MNKEKEKLWERIKWWIYYPRYELIYLLGGIPKQHLNTINYRNIEGVVSSIQDNIKKANSKD